MKATDTLFDLLGWNGPTVLVLIKEELGNDWRHCLTQFEQKDMINSLNYLTFEFIHDVELYLSVGCA